MLSISN